ncbi:hypothetical protein [Coraliomargarita parva]|uniref:hypothetical protein n=1 Tax=Coraliomargarita parva TaxID=3014050 RepID=UPI0022B5E220|nr:hypothetical protein [Coraliomargarita parva]
MRHLIPAVLLFAFAASGCKKDKELVNADELALALNLFPAIIEIPETFHHSRELFFFHKETSEGHDDWFSAFKTPRPGGTVKFLSDYKNQEINILIDDDKEKITHKALLNTNGFERSGGWPSGEIDYSLFVVLFSDTDLGIKVADPHFGYFLDPKAQEEADQAKWVRFTLVAAPDVPEDAPPYVHSAIKKNRELLAKQKNEESH